MVGRPITYKKGLMMTNDELFARLKVEIGWLRNELNFMRSAYEQQSRQLEELRRHIDDRART
jgi:hypothetical protein